MTKQKLTGEHRMFDNKTLWMLLIPLRIEQLLNSFMGMVITMMVGMWEQQAISAEILVTPSTTWLSRCFPPWRQVRRSFVPNI